MSEQNRAPLIVDTREPYEYEASHVVGAINVSVTEFASGVLPSAFKDTPKDYPIILYCRSGQRSNTCSMILRSYGYNNLTNGINEHHVAKLIGRS